MRLKNVLGMLKGKDRIDTIERWTIFTIFAGLVLFALGTFGAIWIPQGFTVVIALLGSFIIFIFTIVLILIWLLRDKGK